MGRLNTENDSMKQKFYEDSPFVAKEKIKPSKIAAEVYKKARPSSKQFTNTV